MLRPLWADANQLIINGDTAEVHHPSYWADAAREVLALHDLTEADGVELTLISGNHDAFLTDQRHLHLAHGRVFVTHGDVLHPAVAPWSIRADHMRKAHAAAMAEYRDDHDRHSLEVRLRASQVASHAEWTDLNEQASHAGAWQTLARPWAVAHVLWYWRQIPNIAAQFVRDHAPEAHFLLLGHTHRPGVWHRGDRTIINTGCFGFPGRPYGVVIESGVLRVLRIKRVHDSWRFADRPTAEFEIPAHTHTSASHDDGAHMPLLHPSARKTRPGSSRPSASAM